MNILVLGFSIIMVGIMLFCGGVGVGRYLEHVSKPHLMLMM